MPYSLVYGHTVLQIWCLVSLQRRMFQNWANLFSKFIPQQIRQKRIRKSAQRLPSNVCFAGFSLNGELMMDLMGQEIAFKGIDVAEPYVPAFSLGAGQHARINFGQVRYSQTANESSSQHFLDNFWKEICLTRIRKATSYSVIFDVQINQQDLESQRRNGLNRRSTPDELSKALICLGLQTMH